MELLFIDESNVNPEQGPFFIVGGLIIGHEELGQVSNKIDEIRDKYGFQRNDSLKFTTNSRPEHVSAEDFKRAKSDVIEILLEHNAKLMIYVILHSILKPENKFSYAYNVLLYQFNSIYLERKDSFGIVIVDRLPENAAFDLIQDKFIKGIDTPSGLTIRAKRIVHFSVSADQTSNLSSGLDIALGAFRYCCNAITSGEGTEVASNMLPRIAHLIWGEQIDGKRVLAEYGFLKFPKTVRSSTYSEIYGNLTEKLTEWSNT